MMALVLILVSLAALACAAFFAGSETGFLSVSRERVLHLSREGGRKARVLQRILNDMSRATTTLLIGNNLSSVIYSTATAALIADYISGTTMQSVCSFLAAFTVLYVSEFMPKLLFAARPLRRSLAVAETYSRCEIVLGPLVAIAMKLTNVFVRGKQTQRYQVTSADLMRILQDRNDGVRLSDFESALISRLVVLRVKKRRVTAEEILKALRNFES